MKKILGLILAAIIMLNCFTVVYADEVSIVVQAERFDDGVFLENWSDSIRMYINSWLSFDVTIPEPGIYGVIAVASQSVKADSTVKFHINDVEKGTGIISQTGGDKKWKEFRLGTFTVEEAGNITIKFTVPNGNFTFDRFILNRAPEFRITNQYTENGEFMRGDTIPRGTDSISLEFSSDIDDSSINPSAVNISDGSNDIAYEYAVEGNTLILYPTQVFEYEKMYAVTITDIKSIYEQSISDQIVFYTSDSSDDSGRGKVVLDDSLVIMRHENIYAEGIVYTGADVPIEGRKVSITVTDSENNTETCENIAVTDSNGKFTIDYDVSDNILCGNITVHVYDEYSVESDSAELMYVSVELEQDVLSGFEDTTDSESVEEVFDNLFERVGYRLPEETAQLSDINGFYRHFLGLTVTDMNDFSAFCTKHAVMELVLQTDNADVVEEIISSSEKCTVLGINKDKADVITINRESLINDIISIENVHTSGEFLMAFNKILQRYYVQEGAVVIEAESYDDGQFLGDWTDCMRLYNNNWLTYTYNFPDAGFYKIVASVSQTVSGDSTIKFQLDGKDIGSGKVTKTGGDKNWVDILIGAFNVTKKGETTIMVTVPTGNFTFNRFTIAPVADFELSGFSANGVSYNDTDVIARGTDVIKLDFTSDIDGNSITDNSLVIKSSGRKISYSFVAENDIITLNLKECLDYNSEYTIIFNNIKSMYSQQYSGTMNFVTGDVQDDIGTGSIVADAQLSKIKYEDITLYGTVYSSSFTPIKGRKVRAEITDYSGVTTTFENVAVSGENGSFVANLVLPEGTPDGSITVNLYDEYNSTGEALVLMHVSRELESSIVSSLLYADTIDKVKDVFERLKDASGFDISSDLAQFGDTDAFYNKFMRITLADIDEFVNYCSRELVTEKLLQTSDPQVVTSFMNDEAKCKLLGVNKAKADYIEISRSRFAQAVIELQGPMSADAFVAEYNRLVEEYYITESGKVDSQTSLTNKKGYVGQGIELVLGYAVPQLSVSGVTYTLTSSDGSIFDIMSFSSSDAQVTRNGNILTVKCLFDKPVESLSSVGTLTITLPETAKTYTVSVSGKTEYSVAMPYPVTTNIIPLDITIEANINNSRPQGGGSASSFGGGGSSSGGASVGGSTSAIVPEHKPSVPGKYEFEDISDVAWAQEGISALVSIGVISKSEDKKYRPNDNVTREEFVKLLVSVFGTEGNNNSADFTDVDSSAWYASYVSDAVAYGLVNGRSDGSFGIGESITRQDMAVMVYRGLVKLGYPMSDAAQVSYSDEMEISDYAHEAISEISKRGIMNGTGNNLFSPGGFVTRAMAAKVIFEISKVVGL